nr:MULTISPECIES: MBL fold metallo-hydrolase [Sphingobium]
MRITMVGHASLLIQTGRLNILTDPVWSNRSSPFTFAGPRRVTAPGIRMGDLPPIDVILLSHNHYDHLDIATLRDLHVRYAPRIITPLGNDSIIRRHIRDARVDTGDWFDCFGIAPGDAHRTCLALVIAWRPRPPHGPVGWVHVEGLW